MKTFARNLQPIDDDFDGNLMDRKLSLGPFSVLEMLGDGRSRRSKPESRLWNEWRRPRNRWNWLHLRRILKSQSCSVEISKASGLGSTILGILGKMWKVPTGLL